MKKAFVPFFILVCIVCAFFYQFLLLGKLPIPSDTIVGLYYPFRDLYSQTNPNGLPYKNFLVTDPVRQQYVWKYLSIIQERQLQLPLWNPYEMAGTPLLANFQSSPFYPLNPILFIPPFSISWSFFIALQPLLAGIFLFLFLKNLKLNTWACLVGSITWMFSGFFIAWMEWGVILHTILWLPLILLAIDKGFIAKNLKWKLIFIGSLSSSFLGGHLQIFFYVLIFSFVYFFTKLSYVKEKGKIFGSFIFDSVLVLLITFFQWFPTLQFILRSNRFSDQSYTQPGWFIPWQNLLQFISPDFFGNPATLNYYGIWNYAEFVGYVGVLPLIFALYALFIRRDKKTFFFSISLIVSLVFALPTGISSVPFILGIPFLSTAQPTRLLSVSCFSLAVLTALGFDYFLQKRFKIWIPLSVLGVILAVCWITVSLNTFGIKPQDILVSKSNLKLPTVLFFVSTLVLLSFQLYKKKKTTNLFVLLFIAIILFDLFRFGWKFTPFTKSEYLFPNTQVLEFLQKQKGVFRIATTDSRILPPNFSAMYGLESIEGYDPLYLFNYAQFTAFNERSDHSITPPFNFNRIITPRNLSSQAIDFLNVKYVLSLDDVNSSKFKKVFQSGLTKVYENTKVLPRAFFVNKIVFYKNESDMVEKMINNDFSKSAVMGWGEIGGSEFSVGKATIVKHSPNKIIIETENKGDGYLITSDTYYPSTRVTIDGQDHSSGFLPANIAFRGIFVPAGKHTVTFEPKLFFFM